MSVGGDPAEIARLAARGRGQTFALDHAGRRLDQSARWYRIRSSRPRADAAPTVAGLLTLVTRMAELDGWTASVARALARADATGVDRLASQRVRILELGPDAAVADLLDVVGDQDGPATPAQWRAVVLDAATPAELQVLQRWSDLPPAVRDEVVRRLVQDAARTLLTAGDVDADRSAATFFADRVVRWIDDNLLDRSDPLIALVETEDERRMRAVRDAYALRWLLRQPDLTMLAFELEGADPLGAPTLRVALGDPATADATVVLVAGTGSGVGNPLRTIENARALHRTALLTGQGTVATVVELYGAPQDLGHAVDPRYGAAAAPRLAAYLTTEGLAPTGRVTVVGHSYGAFTVGRTMAAGAGRATDAVVLLGAPGAGVDGAAALGLPPTGRVWVARTLDDPVRFAADADVLVAKLDELTAVDLGPLAEPLAVLGADPADGRFGARTMPVGDTRGHTDYLSDGTRSLENVARIVVGLPPLG